MRVVVALLCGAVHLPRVAQAAAAPGTRASPRRIDADGVCVRRPPMRPNTDAGAGDTS